MSKKIAVTGANGYLGSHCVIALLEAGFDVVAVVRDPTNEAKTVFLKDAAAKIGKAENLSFGSGDLFKSGSYNEAFSGCWGVLHSAAVIPMDRSKDPYETLVRPAVEGTENVLESIKLNSETIQRFVNISSTAAVQNTSNFDKESNTYFMTDDTWNTESTVENGEAYHYAKTEAEKIVNADEALKECVGTIVSLNPSIIIGPCLSKSHAENGSASIITVLLKGYSTPDVTLPFVDVRDVAKGVVLAFTQDEQVVTGQRFILNGITIGMKELGLTVQKVYPSAKGSDTIGSSVSTKVINGIAWLVNTIPVLEKNSLFKKILWSTRKLSYDTTKAKTVLGIGEFRGTEETCKDAAESIAELIGFEEK